MGTRIIVGHQERSIVLILQSYYLPQVFLCQKNYGCVRISNQGVPLYSSECMLLHESSLLGKTGADWDSALEQTGTLLMLQS